MLEEEDRQALHQMLQDNLTIELDEEYEGDAIFVRATLLFDGDYLCCATVRTS